MDTRIDQANDRVVRQEPHPDSPEHDDRQALVDRLMSEVDYLRGQLDKQTHLLAASMAQTSDMVKQLKALPRERPPLGEKVRGMFNRLRKNTPDTYAEGNAS